MKKCKEGHYYCYQDSKCKPIPKGFRRGVGGYLRREREDEKEDSKKNGNGNGKSNGSSNGNGNNGNGSGNGNGSSGGNGGGNGSGGVGESFETIQNSDGETTAVVVDIIGPMNMRPRLNGEGVWKGTHITEAGKIAFGGYKDGIIINPSGSRNKYGLPDNLKPEEKTKEVPLTPSQNRLLVSKGKKNISASHKPKGSLTEVSLNPSQFLGALNKAKQISRTSKMNQAMADADKINGDPNLTKSDSQVTQVGDQAPVDPMTVMAPRKINKKIKKLNPKDVGDFIPNLKIPPTPEDYPTNKGGVQKAHYEPDGKLTENAAVLSKGSKLLPKIATGIGLVGTMLQARKKRKIGAMEKRLMDREMNVRDNDMIKARRGEADKQNELIDKYERKQNEKNIRKNIIKGVKGGEVVQDEYIPERKMTEKEKRKDDRLKKKYDKSDMKKSMQKQYGKEEGKKVYFATIRKQAMEEEKKKDHEPEMIRSQLKTAKRASKRIKSHTLKKDNFKAWVQSKITKASDYLDTAADYLDSKDDMKEELNKKDKPYIKKLVKNLRKGSKTHAKQADKLEKAMNEESNPRIPRKKGQPANSKKHSDLYTDENPKGTIHGLGFKDVATAKASVSKIRKSNRSHAHKIQAAVAMEQRAREMGKTSEAAVYRKFINSMKKKTKK